MTFWSACGSQGRCWLRMPAAHGRALVNGYRIKWARNSVFSMVRKIDTDWRLQLGNDTLRALLSCKINTDDACYAFVPDKDLCKTAKVATWNYVREHQWSSVSVLGDMNVFLFWFILCWSISCKLLSNNKIWYSLSWKVLCYLRPPDLCINPLFTYNARFSETLRFTIKARTPF